MDSLFMSENGPPPQSMELPIRVPKVGKKRPDQKIEVGQLLPGIPNQITLDVIAPKLPWTAFHILSSVSHSWQRAIQRHQVYESRVRSKSTQTLVALTYQVSKDNKSTAGVALYSTEDGYRYRLPPIPSVDRGIPWLCGCVFLDGKLYILGGLTNIDRMVVYNPSHKVYVFDLAGQRQWEECASMKKGRETFGCGVKDGKIYVFEGCVNLEPVCGSEVYDPKRNVWSPIESMPTFGFRNHVTNVGDEIFVHDGQKFHPGFFVLEDHNYTRKDEREVSIWDHIWRASRWSAAFYNPLKQSWRTLEDFNQTSFDVVLMVREKLRRLSKDGIEVYDKEAGTWKEMQPIVFDTHVPRDSFRFTPIAAVTVDDEILAVVQWSTANPETPFVFENEPTCVIRSEGVGGGNNDIVWQKLDWSIDLFYGTQSFMCPVQL